MAKQTITKAQLNRILVRGGRVKRKAGGQAEKLAASEIEEAAIGPEPSPNPVIEAAPKVEVATPAAAPPPVDNSLQLRVLRASFDSRITEVQERSGQIIDALRFDLEKQKIRTSKGIKPVAWTHKIRRTAKGLVDTVISWRTGEKIVAWTHKIIRSRQGLIDAIESSDGTVTLRHNITRKNGLMDVVHTTKAK